jgi:hypothetical protein
MKKLLLSIFCFLWLLPGFAQVEIKDFDTKGFPMVSFLLRSYDPEVRTINDVRILEEDTLVVVKDVESLGAPSIPAMKSVLFLWDLRSKESFVPELLFDFFNGMVATSQANDSLMVNVAVFRSDEEGKPLYTPLFSSFTSDLLGMGSRVVEEAEMELTETASSSNIVWALKQAVDQIKTRPVDEAKAIVLCTAGKNNLNS